MLARPADIGSAIGLCSSWRGRLAHSAAKLRGLSSGPDPARRHELLHVVGKRRNQRHRCAGAGMLEHDRMRMQRLPMMADATDDLVIAVLAAQRFDEEELAPAVELVADDRVTSRQ